MRWLALLSVIALLGAAPPHPPARDKHIALPDGTRIDYLEVLPPDYQRRKDWYPMVLALPPGPQTRDMAEAGIARWRRQWQDAGWVVLAPWAPDGQTFNGDASKHLGPLTEALAKRYAPDGTKFHLVGISNGGRSAFTAALAAPDRFHSMVVLPGLPTTEQTARLGELTDLPITLVVGSEDGGWTSGSADTAKALSDAGGKVELVVLEGEGHHAFQQVTHARLAGWLGKR